jgi:hypothetical protein
MINRYLPFFAIFFGICTASPAALAQNCNVNYEEMAKLITTEVGAYNLWDTIQGEIESDEVYKTGLLIENGDLVVAGRGLSKKAENNQLVVARIGRNGRVLWEEFHKIVGLEDVIRIEQHEKGFIIVGDQKADKGRDAIWIGFFNALGSLLSEKQIINEKAELHAFDLMPTKDRKSYLLAATLKLDSLEQPSSAVLYQIDTTGKVFQDKAFINGMENRISGLDMLGDGGVVATGYSFSEDGRKNGWIMRLNPDFGIDWQQLYPRGAGAALVAGHSMLSNTIAVVGTAAPAKKGGLRAGWVMVVSEDSGSVGWQRFFTSEQHYTGRDLNVTEDGIISVMLDGDKAGETIEPEHIRLLTLNPRGSMFSSEPYINGEAVDGYQMILGPNKEHIVIGRTLVERTAGPAKPDEPKTDPKAASAKTEPAKVKVATVKTQDAWIVATPSTEPYKDPCIQSFNFLP